MWVAQPAGCSGLRHDKRRVPDVHTYGMKITDEQAAADVSAAMNDVFHRLGASLLVVRERCSIEEAEAYQSRIGDLFYNVIFKVLEPLYVDHPHLRPEDWDDRSPMDPD